MKKECFFFFFLRYMYLLFDEAFFFFFYSIFMKVPVTNDKKFNRYVCTLNTTMCKYFL